MATFAISKFEPESDPTRPVVGSVIAHKGEDYIIRRVEWRDKKKLVAAILRGESEETEDSHGHDEILYEDHKDRIFVMWIVWVDKANKK